MVDNQDRFVCRGRNRSAIFFFFVNYNKGISVNLAMLLITIELLTIGCA